jgi:hypothetical protein
MRMSGKDLVALEGFISAARLAELARFRRVRKVRHAPGNPLPSSVVGRP